MCGIAGILKLDSRASVDDVAAVLRMTDAEVHRGPDDWGLLLPEPALQHAGVRALLAARDPDHIRAYSGSATGLEAVLGTRRLSIIDLSLRGRMPMCSAEKRVWITYNGEIYNHRELRAELERCGYGFQSAADTETILYGYKEWGEEVIERLRGMFAFALFDARSVAPRLILAKDRFGIKPLYYYQDPSRFVFASEVRALMRSGMVPDEKNLEAFIRFLQLSSIPIPQTTIKGVLALPAGSYLVIDQSGARMKRYWHPAPFVARSAGPGDFPSLEAASRLTRACLDESVKRHLISDVPLGIFLSGGIDSSALVGLASQFRAEPLTTLSVTFDEPEYNEARYAHLVAKRYQTDHREVLLRSQDFFEEIPRIFDSMDQPTGDGVNTYFVSKAAKQAGLTVVLSGIGGDEIFLGYPFSSKAHTYSGSWNLFSKLPLGLRSGLIDLATRTGTFFGKRGLEKLTYLESPSAKNLYLLFRGLFTPRQIQDLLGITEQEFQSISPLPEVPNGIPTRSIVDSLTLYEFSYYLQNQLLKDTDFMSMAHSIEVRVPFLDHQLVEQVLSIPVKLRLGNGINKPLLVKALGNGLPTEVKHRTKMGFTFPFGEWIKGKAEELQAQSLDQSLLDRRATKTIWKKFNQGQAHWSRPWALVVLSSFKF